MYWCFFVNVMQSNKQHNIFICAVSNLSNIGLNPMTMAAMTNIFINNLVQNTETCQLYFINTKTAFKELSMFYFETFQIILNPSSVKKQSNTW